MSAAVLLLLLAGLAQEDDAGIVAATFRCEPQEVEVGEPFWLVLDLLHPAGTSVFELGTSELELDGSWVVLERRREPPVPLAAGGGDPANAERRRTRRLWRVASLEPGSRSLADVVSTLVLDERVGSVNAAAASVEVAGVLGPDEDAPRPLRAFPDGFGQEPAVTMTPLRWLALALAVSFWAALLVLFWRRFRRRRPRTVAPEDPLALLERLRERAAAGPVAVRAQHYELTTILRRATDARLGVRHDGLTDEEWLAIIQASGELPSEVAQGMAQVFERAEAVKYAGVAPSSWALDETFGQARRTLEGVGAGSAGKGGAS